MRCCGGVIEAQMVLLSGITLGGKEEVIQSVMVYVK